MKPIRLATVFSGIGAIEWAFKRLSFPYEVVFACDNGEREVKIDIEEAKKHIEQLSDERDITDYIRDLYSSKTRKTNWVEFNYLQNYGDLIDKTKFYNDIRLLDARRYQDKVDVLVGGSPCQSFSVIGKQLGFEDTRGTLFYEFARIVKETRPNVFIYENVKGIMARKNVSTFETILHVLRNEFGYDVSYSVFNATQFNIPQNRSRVLVVGTKRHAGFDVSGIETEELTRTMQDFLEDNCAEGHFLSKGDGTISMEKIKGSPSESLVLSPAVTRYVLKGGTKTWYMKPETDKKVARTLLKTMSNHHRAGVDNYITIDASKDKYRALSPRECFRLMGFTDEFKIDGVPRSHLYMQAGNSIVVDVLVSLLKSLEKAKLIGG